MYSSISNRFLKMRTKQMIFIRKYHLINNNRFAIKTNLNKNINNNYLIASNFVPFRHLFRFPLKTPLSSSKVKNYSERRVLGYSKEQLFEVVSRVEDYHLFVPACVKSKVTQRTNSYIRADLEIGIPPLIWEKYTSRVTLVKPTLVKAVCIDGKIFKHLETNWKLSDGLPNNKNSCTLDFKLSFEFKSYIHSQLVHVFFDEMARQTVNAFLKRAETLYGKQSLIISNQ